MKLFKFLILLILALLIFGSSGYFAYQLFIKPSQQEKKEKAAEAAAPVPTATPDPSIPEFQRLKALQVTGKIEDARNGLTAWITNYPQSSLMSEARQLLGSDNMALLFTSEGTNAITYTVVKGDSLARISGKFKSNAELIQRANQLPTINLQIGQQLVIPALKISLEIDRSAKSITLLNNGIFLKEYTFVAAPPAPINPETKTSRILDKVSIFKNKRVAFGDKAYPMSERSLLLVQSPAIVAPAPTPPPPATSAQGTTPAPTPSPESLGGYVLSANDLLEIFPLVSRNTPVIIH